jgi:hypothetical protein
MVMMIIIIIIMAIVVVVVTIDVAPSSSSIFSILQLLLLPLLRPLGLHFIPVLVAYSFIQSVFLLIIIINITFLEFSCTITLPLVPEDSNDLKHRRQNNSCNPVFWKQEPHY